MLVVLIVVIAVASGLACLNLLIIAAFCLFRQRRKDIRDLGEDELGSLEDRLSPVKRIRSNPQIQRHHSRNEKAIETQWPLTHPIVHKPTNATRLDATNLLETLSLKPPLSSLSRPNDHLSVPANFGISRASTRTDRSERTVSIYSTESAPPHFHDQLSNPVFVNKVVKSNLSRTNLPRGMNLPSSVTRDIELFIRPPPKSGTANLPSNSNNIRLRDKIYARASVGIPNSHFDPSAVKSSNSQTTPAPRFATTLEPELPNRVQLLYRGVNPQALPKSTSTSSFPPPLW
jgi:hypothetical protein